jgi:putative FmdB family regulatory protein
MPLYEYECDACSHRFERIRKFSDPPLDTCPSCGGTVRKLLSSPAIQFKGSGWYITDYAKKGSSDGKGAGSSSEKSEKSEKSDKSEKTSTESTASSSSTPSTSSSGSGGSST